MEILQKPATPRHTLPAILFIIKENIKVAQREAKKRKNESGF